MKLPLLLCALGISLIAHAETVKLAPGPSPADNPLKGLVPYAKPEPGCFPHSLEFDYLRFSDLMMGPESFDWQPLEKLLDGIASRGNQTVFRVWIEYPGQKSGLPKFLRDQGVKVTEWTETEKKPREKVCFTPDYEDERLIRAMQSFIKALGQRYDGDARIGYITAGLLGSWGEWHTYPREDLFASVQTQKRVLDAYEKAQAQARSQAQATVAEAGAKAAEEASRRHAELAETLAKRIAESEAAIVRAKDQALASLRTAAVEVAIAATERLIGEKPDAGAAAAAVDAAAKSRA